MTPLLAKQLEAAKAYASLLGALLTAFIASSDFADDTTMGKVLAVASALLTAFLTYQVPNAKPEEDDTLYDGHGTPVEF